MGVSVSTNSPRAAISFLILKTQKANRYIGLLVCLHIATWVHLSVALRQFSAAANPMDTVGSHLRSCYKKITFQQDLDK